MQLMSRPDAPVGMHTGDEAMRGKGWAGLVAASVLGFLVSGCSEDSTGSEGCESISLATLDDASHRAAMYAIESGKVESDAVAKVQVDYLQIPALIQATGSGQYDVLSTSLPGLILAREASGQDLRIVGFGGAHTGGGMAIYVREGSGITSIADLEGKTLGTFSFGSSTTVQTQMVLAEKYGLDYPLEGGDIEWVELDPPTLLNAVQQGDVDAAMLFYQASWQADQDQDLVKIAQIDEDYTEIANGARPVTSVFIADSSFTDDSECADALQSMLASSADYAEEHIAEFAPEIAELTGADPEFVAYSWQPENYLFGGGVDDEWIDWAEEFYDLAIEHNAIPVEADATELVYKSAG